MSEPRKVRAHVARACSATKSHAAARCLVEGDLDRQSRVASASMPTTGACGRHDRGSRVLRRQGRRRGRQAKLTDPSKAPATCALTLGWPTRYRDLPGDVGRRGRYLADTTPVICAARPERCLEGGARWALFDDLVGRPGTVFKRFRAFGLLETADTQMPTTPGQLYREPARA